MWDKDLVNDLRRYKYRENDFPKKGYKYVRDK